MANFKIVCSHCHQTAVVPDRLLGKSMPCPSCDETIHLPNPEALKTEAVMDHVHEKRQQELLQSPEEKPSLGKAIVFCLIAVAIGAAIWLAVKYGGKPRTTPPAKPSPVATP